MAAKKRNSAAVGGRDPGAAAMSRTGKATPLLADTRITIVILPYLLRWQPREESITNLHSRAE